jgi:hypothetical protein
MMKFKILKTGEKVSNKLGDIFISPSCDNFWITDNVDRKYKVREGEIYIRLNPKYIRPKYRMNESDLLEDSFEIMRHSDNPDVRKLCAQILLKLTGMLLFK